jgi:serine phosphatase RsbU (regulator of sigma subunit)/TPR repeat protein
MINKYITYFFLRLIIVLFLFNSNDLFAQLDSVQFLVAKENSATKKIDILLNASEIFSGKEISISFSQLAYQLACKEDNNDLIARSSLRVVFDNMNLKRLDSIRYYQDVAIKGFKKTNNLYGLYDALSSKFRYLKSHEKPEAAFEVYKELIELAEKLEDPLKFADAYYYNGELFSEINDVEKAISYYNKALKIYMQIENSKGIIDCYFKLGTVNTAKGYYDIAIEYFERALKISSQANNINRVGILTGIGNVYYSILNVERALYYYQEALASDVAKNNEITLKNNIGVSLLELRKFKEAKPYLIEVYFSVKNARDKADGAYNLALLYDSLRDYKSAIEYKDIYVNINDSLNAILFSKNLSETEAKYQNEKKEEQNIILGERLKNKSLQIYFALAGILLLLVFAFFIYRGSRQKNKANKALAEKNKIIEEKSIIVEEQHKDITDSIKYAQRIQRAILPPDKLWKSILPNSFVFYQPKDILSGDFYWIEETAEHIYIAAADCTGHGVPVALMSIVNYNLLNKAVLEQELTDAGKILDSVNKLLTQSLHQTFQESAVRDGMDISLCVINKITKQLNYAGAFNSIYIIRNNEIKELIPDKQPVGAFIEDNIKPFTNKYFQLIENDVVYMFTDGYADQFGGENGKKFKYKNLQHLLLEIHHKPFSEQKKIVSNWINDWKGNLEQIDDMLLIGYKVS